MTPDRITAAAALADLLAAENNALQRLDFRAAVALLPAKDAAMAALTAACVQPWPPAAATVGRRLLALAAENRALLERAITVQTRVVGIVAQAARQQTGQSYAPNGQRPQPTRPPATTLSARA